MKVLVACDMHSSFMDDLKKNGLEVDYKPDIENHEVSEIIKHYAGLVVSTKISVDREMIDLGKRLQFIARAGSGIENIDRGYAFEKGIFCYSSPEGNRDAVAEHVIGMLLSLFNNIILADTEIGKGIWHREPNRGLELKGKTLSIIGYGNTGSTLAKKLSGFGMNLLAYDKYKSGFSDTYIQEADMEMIFQQTDILSLHVPLTEETEGLINREYIGRFQKPIYLVNTSRGKIVDTQQLLDMLDEEAVLGACLDVLENEDVRKGAKSKLPWFHDLVMKNNVVLTPHVAGWTIESRQKIGEVLLEKIMSNPLAS